MTKVANVQKRFKFKSRKACICGSLLKFSNAHLYVQHAWGPVRFLRCARCWSWCQSPQIVPSSLAALYDSDAYQGSAQKLGTAYENYEADEVHRYQEAQARLRFDIEPWLINHPSSILEIGCASGTLLAAARDRGHRVAGLDLSSRFSEQAKRLNKLNVRVGNVLKFTCRKKKYDAVFIFGTVSNLPDLEKVLRKIRGLINREGKLFINFPDSLSFIAKVYAEKMWMFSPTVITFPSSRGLVLCAKNAGWRIEEDKTDWQRPSLRKLFKHSRISFVLPAFLTKNLGNSLFPFRIPIPGIRFFRLSPIANYLSI